MSLAVGRPGFQAKKQSCHSGGSVWQPYLLFELLSSSCPPHNFSPLGCLYEPTRKRCSEADHATGLRGGMRYPIPAVLLDQTQPILIDFGFQLAAGEHMPVLQDRS